MIRDCDQTMPATAWYLVSKTYSSGCLANNANAGDSDQPELVMLWRQSYRTLLPNKELVESLQSCMHIVITTRGDTGLLRK